MIRIKVKFHGVPPLGVLYQYGEKKTTMKKKGGDN